MEALQQDFQGAGTAVLKQWKHGVTHSSERKLKSSDYFYNNPDVLLATSKVGSFIVGAGDDIFGSILPEVEEVQAELILVTCFWAASSSRDRLNDTLRKISGRVLRDGRPKVRVFIGLSSVSLFQKLFHTSSPRGYTYAPSEWPSKLGLPSSSELKGLDFTVKSMFFLPFSVWHPKFIIVDRRQVFLPSCNVSWETWFEGCLTLSGPVVAKFVNFWSSFWGSHVTSSTWVGETHWQPSLAQHDDSITTAKNVMSVFLPSPHHRNPRFRPLPWQKPVAPPSTPLNVFLRTLFSSAMATIYIQTPNVTASCVLADIFDVLQRGINVHIVTSERLMILEQLGTSGTTTSRCMKRLVRRYKRFQQKATASDEEAGLHGLGKLRIEYYIPRPGQSASEPVQSHLKLTVVDNQWVVLGSGNMDRASFYTSQELGVAFFDTAFAKTVMDAVGTALHERKKLYFTSTI